MQNNIEKKKKSAQGEERWNERTRSDAGQGKTAHGDTKQSLTQSDIKWSEARREARQKGAKQSEAQCARQCDAMRSEANQHMARRGKMKEGAMQGIATQGFEVRRKAIQGAMQSEGQHRAKRCKAQRIKEKRDARQYKARCNAKWDTAQGKAIKQTRHNANSKRGTTQDKRRKAGRKTQQLHSNGKR
jgi:hypothetical protein